jgi:hypothetical protein
MWTVEVSLAVNIEIVNERGVFERMNSKFEEDIAALESQIVEADLEKATFEQL